MTRIFVDLFISFLFGVMVGKLANFLGCTLEVSLLSGIIATVVCFLGLTLKT